MLGIRVPSLPIGAAHVASSTPVLRDQARNHLPNWPGMISGLPEHLGITITQKQIQKTSTMLTE